MSKVHNLSFCSTFSGVLAVVLTFKNSHKAGHEMYLKTKQYPTTTTTKQTSVFQNLYRGLSLLYHRDFTGFPGVTLFPLQRQV